jgi:hypothetical protein
VATSAVPIRLSTRERPIKAPSNTRVTFAHSSTTRIRRAAFVAIAGLFTACAYTPTPPSPFSSATSQVLKGTVYPGGTTTLWLVATRPGTFSLRLANVDPDGLTLGIGFGLLSAGGCEQRLYVRAQTSGASQLSSQVDAGTYCVDVSDLGSVGLSGAQFSIEVQFQ